MNRFVGKKGVLIPTFILFLGVLVVGCSRPSRDNDRFLSRAPSELREHYKFIDTYRGMDLYKLDSVIQLFDNRYDKDSSSIESAYYNLAFAYREYGQGDDKGALSRLFRAGNAIGGHKFSAFEAEINLLAGSAYKNLALNKFAEEYFKKAYSYFVEGDYPDQTMLAAFNLAYLASSDSLKESSSSVDSYVDLCDSIFINHHDRVKYVNYYHHKYIIDKYDIDKLDSLLTAVDIAEEPSISLQRLYNMNINLLIALEYKGEYDKARVVLNRTDSIYRSIGERCLPRLRSFHLFEKSIVLTKEGHYERALDAYKYGVSASKGRSNVRIDPNRYRALYKIYYAIGDVAKSDSALTCHRDAYDRLLLEQERNAASSLFEYQDFAKQRSIDILKNNELHRYIQSILVIIGLILVAYLLFLYRENLKIKKRSQLKYGDQDKYIEQLEAEIRESNRSILELEIDQLLYEEFYPDGHDDEEV